MTVLYYYSPGVSTATTWANSRNSVACTWLTLRNKTVLGYTFKRYEYFLVIGDPIPIWNVFFANKSRKLGWIWMKLGRWGHRHRSSVNFGGKTFCRKIYAWKINKMPEFYMVFARKINKIPEFYMIYARKKLTKCRNFTWFLPEKYFSGFFWGVEGKCPSCPSPASRLPRL